MRDRRGFEGMIKGIVRLGVEEVIGDDNFSFG